MNIQNQNESQPFWPIKMVVSAQLYIWKSKEREWNVKNKNKINWNRKINIKSFEVYKYQSIHLSF